MSTIRVNNVTDELGTGAPDFPNGITIDTVTVSGKIVHTGDTDTSIGFPINDTITMDTAGTERMRIDSSGKVLIGTATSVSNNMLVIAQASGDGVNSGFLMQRNGAAGTSFKIDIDSSDVANFRRGVTNAMSIDSSGNIGVGATPSDWVIGAAAIQFPSAVSCSQYGYIRNAYYDGTTYRYITTGPSTRYQLQSTGNHAWSIAASGTAGAAFSYMTGMILDNSGNVGIGTTSPDFPLDVSSTGVGSTIVSRFYVTDNTVGLLRVGNSTTGDGSTAPAFGADATSAVIYTNNTERVRISSNGSFFIGTTSLDPASASDVGFTFSSTNVLSVARSASAAMTVGRQTDDGTIVTFRQAGVTEGSITVSGTTVSYNGGHLSRWAQFPDNSRPELLKGTVMSNLDQMSNWSGEDNEQLNCVQVSTAEGDANVAGVFVAWDSEDDGYNDILLAMTGDMVIRIAAGTTVQRGDLLMSAGDGTAKPQGDDIVRSKTIAKVTSTHISHIYEDGSYCVPCVIMAC